MKCKHCDGKGVTKEYTMLHDVKTRDFWQKTRLCLHCLGDGELDWIEAITGKDRSNAGNLIGSHPTTVWVV